MSLSLCLDTSEQKVFGPEKCPIDHETKTQQLEKTFVISSISNLATPPASPGQSESRFVFEPRSDIPSPPQTPVQSTSPLIHDPPVTITKAKSKDIASVQKFLNQSLDQSFDASFLLQHLYKQGYFLLIASSAVDRNQGVTNCTASHLDPDATLRNHPTNNNDSLTCLSYTDNNIPTASLADVGASVQCAHREPGLVGVIAGYIQPCPACPSGDHAASAYLSILAVHPTHQSRGIGSSLLSRLEHELKSESIKTCNQTCDKSLAAPKPKRPFGWTVLFDTDEDHDKTMTGNDGPLGDELKINQRSEPNDSSTEPSNTKKNDSSTEPIQQTTESSNQVASIVLSRLKSLFLDVETCNTRAQSFYLNHGFDLLGPEKKGYYKQSGKSSFLMEKRYI